MHIHILGICGTFMGSLAQLAKAQGHCVSGCDANVYPPMSTQLQNAGIEIIQGFDPSQLQPKPDLVIVGNAMSRGNPCVEYMLDNGLLYTSGPQWLGDHLLQDADNPRWVLAVSGTHGKTTTASMLAWILEYAGFEPGFLIGGVPKNFEVSARLGNSSFFVVEADEYDSAFFDKRSKFVHYHPRTLIMNNLEFDHADIFTDLAAIQTQFQHMIRTVPSTGRIIFPNSEVNLHEVLARGCWSELETAGVGVEGDVGMWQVELLAADGSEFNVLMDAAVQGRVNWTQTGLHSVNNGLMAIAAARHIGIDVHTACDALSKFAGVKRRMEQLADIKGIKVYDDFAHHPTAIQTTLQGLRKSVGDDKIIAIIEPRSNTMRMGNHKHELANSIADASEVLWFQPPDMDWSLQDVVATSSVPSQVVDELDELLAKAVAASAPNTHIVIMSNGGFQGFHKKLIAELQGLL